MAGPLIAPSILAGFMLAFVLSLDDFVITNFVAGGTNTFPLWVFGAQRVGIPVQVNVMVNNNFAPTPGASGIFPVVLTAANATGTSTPFTLTLTIGGLPAITSALAASGSRNSKTLPWPSLERQDSRAPINCATRRAIGNPRPSPLLRSR